jgi:hypothetical protein
MKTNDFIFALSLAWLVANVFLFAGGMHNIDQAWNLKYLDQQGIHLVDNSIVFSNVDADNLYAMGVAMSMIALILTVVSVALVIIQYKEWRR